MVGSFLCCLWLEAFGRSPGSSYRLAVRADGARVKLLEREWIQDSVREANLGQYPRQPRWSVPDVPAAETKNDGQHDQAHDQRVQRDGDGEDYSHLLGCEWPGKREGEEDGDHDRCRGDDNPAGGVHRPHHGVLRVGLFLVALLGRREQEQRVVHGYAEDHGAEEEWCPGVNVSLGREVEEAGKVAVLEDQPGYPEGTGQRQGGDENPGGGYEWSAERDE